jgi:hypothetical protein
LYIAPPISLLLQAHAYTSHRFEQVAIDPSFLLL